MQGGNGGGTPHTVVLVDRSGRTAVGGENDMGDVEHEHWFIDHEDPRWLICSCGQYAVRARSITGARIVRLIDTPAPAVVRPLRPATVPRPPAREAQPA